MMKLKKPDFSLKDIYPSCISHYKDPNKEKLMKSIAPKLLEDEKRFFSLKFVYEGDKLKEKNIVFY